MRSNNNDSSLSIRERRLIEINYLYKIDRVFTEQLLIISIVFKKKSNTTLQN